MKMFRQTKALCWLFTLVLWCGIGLLSAQFGGGSGTLQDPYLVSNPTHLNNVRYYCSSYFLQTNDIDLDVAPYNSGSGWNAICDPSTPFLGHYEGDGLSISGLYINSDWSFSGLFGSTSGATLRGIRIVNAEVHGTAWVGGLSANSVNTVIEDCHVGVIISGEAYVGGLVGELEGGSVTGCRVTAQLSECIMYGGTLSSTVSDCDISNCCAFGDNTGEMMSGGLLGYVQNSSVANCFSRVNLNGMFNLAGLIYNMSGGSVINCYAAGAIQGAGNGCGLIGSGTSSVTNSYWDTQLSGETSSQGGEGRTTDQMTYPYAANTYVDWDFANVWIADSTGTENDGYPYLPHEFQVGLVAAPTFSHHSGYYNSPIQLTMHTETPNATIHYTLDGSVPNLQSPVYTQALTISATTEVKAYAVRENWVDSLVSVVNIYLDIFSSGTGTYQDPYLVSTPEQLDAVRHAPTACFRQTNDIDLGVPPWNSGNGWIPIGKAGIIPGQDPFSGRYNGLGFAISNLTINSLGEPGGLFGYATAANLSNIRLINLEVHSSSYLGGLVGKAQNCTIDKCSVSGAVYGGFCSGGLAAEVRGSTVTDCYSSAFVTGSLDIGGLIGELKNESSLNRSYSRGLVTGGTNPGGLIAVIQSSQVSYSYWDVQTSGQATSAGGNGKNTDEMTYPYDADCYQTWGFNYIWEADVANTNDGYPFHFRQTESPQFTHTQIQPGEPVLVTISCRTPNAVIYYLLEQSEPNQSSLLYAEPFWIYPDADSLCWISAKAFHPDMHPSLTNVLFLNMTPLPGVEEQTPTPLLLHAWPNPYPRKSGELNMEFQTLPGPAPEACLRIYNLRGQRVRETSLQGESRNLLWDGRDELGELVPPGIYLLRLRQGEAAANLKLLVN